MRRNIDIKFINKTNILEKPLINEIKQHKNLILRAAIKSMDKRYNNNTNNINFKPKIFDKVMFTRQNSNQLMEPLNVNHRNFSNKKLFISNSYKKREKLIKSNEIINNRAKNSNMGNINLDKRINTKEDLKHKKLLSLQTNINNYKKLLKDNKPINVKNQKQNTSFFKPNLINNKLKDYFSLINKNKNLNNSNYNNTSLNKNLFDNKILNKSLEHRRKYTKLQMPNNLKLKQIKIKNDQKLTEKKQKTEHLFNKTFNINNNDYYTHRNKPISKIEICQTFSKDENINNKENKENNISNETSNINEKENKMKNNEIKKEKEEKLLDIDTHNNNLSGEYFFPKTATSNENKKFIFKNEIRSPISSHSKEKYNKLKKLNLADDQNNYKSTLTILRNNKKSNNYNSFNKSKNSLTKRQTIQKGMIGLKHHINSYNIKNKRNLLNLNNINAKSNNSDRKYDKEQNNINNSIFEVISDIKVKSFNEYEEDKKADQSQIIGNSSLNEQKIKNNININININYNNININNNKKSINKQCKTENNNKINKENLLINCNNGEFIEDRDEYNILKETFSKDRFSFRPANNDNNEILNNFQQYNDIVNNNYSINQNNLNKSEKTSLNRKDFIKRNILNGSNILSDYMNKNKNNSNHNKKIDNNKIMKKEISKIQKLKKIIKNKQTSKQFQGSNILNKSVELRYKKLNK